MKFRKDKCKVLSLGQNNLMQKYRLTAGWIEEKDQGAMVGKNEQNK